VVTHRLQYNQWRHFEKLDRAPAGYVALGDSICSFNPIYGQGMACAALQADALGETVREVGVRSEELPRRFHRRAARIIDAPWAIAVGADFLHPKTQGPKARGTDQVNAYVMRLVKASQTSVQLARSFNNVLNLVDPTSSLLRPSVVARVLASSVPVRRRQTRVGHPRVGSPS
jgi:2-polyprenyl-6-methoxyphenol hydroxylase-like FAD-dependent oxidoreductase